MVKRRFFQKEQLKFMVLNLIAFTVIFSIFGVIIYSQVEHTLISKIDEELLAFKEKIKDGPQLGGKSAQRNQDLINKQKDKPRDNMSPRIIVVDWNENGEIINQEQIGTLFYENYLSDYQLDKNTLNTITNMTISDNDFRYILVENTNKNDEIAYTQLLLNIDPEQAILDNFGRLLMVCSIIFVLLSITASFILSKRMMKPIIHSWNKQAEFVENASHELRTPLTIIQNKLELLLTEPQEKIINKFENIALSLSETRRLSKLTSDLLTLARADSAETELVKTELQVDSFVENLCAPYMEIAESQDKHFWLNLNCKTSIEADEVRLHQLLVILLDNALKYTGENDSIGVKTYNEDHRIVLEVTDTGIGIKEENLQYVFERFYREDKARTRETGGVGLGLSIAQWIVKKHNGSIKVKRNETKGTTFIVKLPI